MSDAAAVERTAPTMETILTWLRSAGVPAASRRPFTPDPRGFREFDVWLARRDVRRAEAALAVRGFHRARANGHPTHRFFVTFEDGAWTKIDAKLPSRPLWPELVCRFFRRLPAGTRRHGRWIAIVGGNAGARMALLTDLQRSIPLDVRVLVWPEGRLAQLLVLGRSYLRAWSGSVVLSDGHPDGTGSAPAVAMARQGGRAISWWPPRADAVFELPAQAEEQEDPAETSRPETDALTAASDRIFEALTSEVRSRETAARPQPPTRPPARTHDLASAASLRRQLERPLHVRGYTLLGTGTGRALLTYRLHRTGPFPPGFEGLRRDPGRIFTVELDQVTTPVGFSYHPEGWHPYRATLEESLADPELPYERSALHAYYRRFQPRTVQEALLEHHIAPLEPLCRWPTLLALFKHLWALTPRQVERILARPETEKGPRQQFGPQPDDAGRSHRQRLLAAYDSLERDGYRPAEYPDGALLGYFLVRGDEYRFMVFNGNHRLAPMRQLGIERVEARLHPGHPPVVHGDELERWTTPGGIFELGVAQHLFDKLFAERGEVKARNLGLLAADAG